LLAPGIVYRVLRGSLRRRSTRVPVGEPAVPTG